MSLSPTKIHGEEFPNRDQMLGIQRNYKNSLASAYSNDFGNNRWLSSLRTMLSESDISDESRSFWGWSDNANLSDYYIENLPLKSTYAKINFYPNYF